MSETFKKKLADRRAREAVDRAAAAPAIEFDADLIPDEDGGPSPSPTSDPELDRVIDGIGIVEAYRMWCGKSSPSRRDSRTEGIKVSCPQPTHPDRDPSAWLNTEKNVWHCGSCGVGGDVYDIAAWHFGFGVPDYKEGAAFHALRRKMAEGFGYTFVTAPGLDKPVLVAPEPEVPEPRVKVKESDEADVVSIFDEGLKEPALPRLNWESIAEGGTFLESYMNQCKQDDAPEEYHFWNAMIALGFAVGRDVKLFDQNPVYGNLFVCLLGPTGDGKSRSFHHLRNLLEAALPYDFDDENNNGVDFVSSPGSAEALIHAFSRPVSDPANPKKTAFYAPVRGLIEFNELSSLIGRVARKGSVLKPTLMEFYDASGTIKTSSMTHGMKKAHQPFGSAFTTSQPKALKELLRETDAHSGFLNRWVFATGTPKRRVSVGGVQIDVTPAVAPLKGVQGWSGFGRVVGWSPDALTRFDEFFHEILHPAQQADETSLLARLDLLAKKLILLLSINSHHSEVEAGVVDKVVSMFSYLTSAYGVPAAHIGSTINTEVQTEILRHVRRYTEKKGGISLRDLNKCINRKNFPLDIVSKSLKYMTELGMIEVFTTKGVGRPTVKYKVAG